MTHSNTGVQLDRVQTLVTPLVLRQLNHLLSSSYATYLVAVTPLYSRWRSSILATVAPLAWRATPLLSSSYATCTAITPLHSEWRSSILAAVTPLAWRATPLLSSSYATCTAITPLHSEWRSSILGTKDAQTAPGKGAAWGGRRALEALLQIYTCI